MRRSFISNKILPISNEHNYPNTTFIDIVDNYILASSNNTYFILFNNKIFPLGTFNNKLSNIGNICIHNNNTLLVLLYHNGSFITSNSSHGTSSSGLLFTINKLTLKVRSYRLLSLDPNFLLFGNLYLINGTNISRFNPMTSPSWNKTFNYNIISATVVNNYIILLESTRFHVINGLNGDILWSYNLQYPSKCCVGKDGSLYIVSSHQGIIIVTRGIINNLEFKIVSEAIHPMITNVELICISTYQHDKYIISTDKYLQIYTIDNQQIGMISLNNLKDNYRIIASDVTTPIVVINGTTVNNTKMFDSAGTFNFSSDY